MRSSFDNRTVITLFVTSHLTAEKLLVSSTSGRGIQRQPFVTNMIISEISYEYWPWITNHWLKFFVLLWRYVNRLHKITRIILWESGTSHLSLSISVSACCLRILVIDLALFVPFCGTSCTTLVTMCNNNCNFPQQLKLKLKWLQCCSFGGIWRMRTNEHEFVTFMKNNFSCVDELFLAIVWWLF